MTLHFDPEVADVLAQMRWYTKEGGTPGPAVVYFHGGGYFFGTVARYVSASGVPMLSVEYRRAPEHGVPHEFDSDVARRAIAGRVRVLKSI